MKNVKETVSELVGNTPLLHIKGDSQKSRADIYAKLECFNPAGSAKDRVALEMILAAEADGRLKAMEMRKSHLNPIIKEVYENYFKGDYGCHKAHHTLHTSYTARKKFHF